MSTGINSSYSRWNFFTDERLKMHNHKLLDNFGERGVKRHTGSLPRSWDGVYFLLTAVFRCTSFQLRSLQGEK